MGASAPVSPCDLSVVTTKAAIGGGLAALALAAGTTTALVMNASGSSCGSDVCPGDSFQTAYANAPNGTTLSVAAGSYGTQVMSAVSGKSGIVFQGSSGVNVGQLIDGDNTTRGASGVEFRDMTVSDMGVRNADNVTLRNLKLGGFSSNSANNLSWIGGSIGPILNGVPNLFGSCGGAVPSVCLTNAPAQNVLVDGVYFHDMTISDPSLHSECLQVNGVGGETDGLTIRNSTFQNCTDFGIEIEGTVKNVLIENNFIDQPFPGRPTPSSTCSPSCPRSGDSLDMDVAGSNITVRYNTMLGYLLVRPTRGPTGVSNIGDISGSEDCQSGQTYSHNIRSTSAVCGSGDQANVPLSSVLIDPNSSDGTMDLNLKAGANVAIGNGDPTNFPATDIHGNVRTSPPDVGADQRDAGGGGGTTTTSTTTSTTSTTTTNPPPVTDATIFCNEFVVFIQASNYYPKWLSQNPGEKSRWEPYRNAICAGSSPGPPSMTTNFGKALVAAGKMTL